ncbi:uncharacterized protein LOC141588249 [Silene latifolia]|uniref:uncharacterized protein LOC141588249 n=1 Tax=Silene latifolia TaxID=37657 RepID=UPI003D770736
MAESSVKCEIRIIGAKNIATKRQGALFTRCYLSVGNNRRIQLNTREIITSKKDDNYILWNENFSLECNGKETSISNLKDEKIVFELRWRNTKPNFLGKTSSSKLLSRTEIPWKNVFDAQNMTIQNWVYMSRDDGTECDEECCLKPPALEVGLKVVVPELPKTVSKEEMRRRRRQERLRKWDGCGCKSSHEGGCSCNDNELFLVAAVLDVC